ncbi:hypothetical protein [Mycobacterium sp. 050134]|uniref:hypothetical protein n=1 Tax=Mycobacterium sp. 050134 TaxID=3096111 RepID=UPI002EDB8C09
MPRIQQSSWCSGVLAVVVAGVRLVSPPAHADGNYGPGTYTVPGQLPHGTYTAHALPGDYSAACSFSAWTGDWKLIVADGGTQTVTADLRAPKVATFVTHGCTPWQKVD